MELSKGQIAGLAAGVPAALIVMAGAGLQIFSEVKWGSHASVNVAWVKARFSYLAKTEAGKGDADKDADFKVVNKFVLNPKKSTLYAISYNNGETWEFTNEDMAQKLTKAVELKPVAEEPEDAEGDCPAEEGDAKSAWTKKREDHDAWYEANSEAIKHNEAAVKIQYSKGWSAVYQYIKNYWKQEAPKGEVTGQ